VHLGSRAVGGAACVMQEATAVTAQGRISPTDAGLWNDVQAEAYKPVARFIKEAGAVPGIQLAHAGRKGSTRAPWDKGPAYTAEEGGWEVPGPSPIAFDEGYLVPHEMTPAQINAVVEAFAAAAKRALAAGYEVVEVHAAHGYLLHEFLSPLANARTDAHGGSFENRTRLTMEVASAVRETWPEHLPVFVRISASDWAEGGWDLEQSILLAMRLKEIGIDLIDVSSGGLVPHAKIPAHPGYQVPFAAAIKERAAMPCGAVGLITSPEQAEQIVATGQADVVLLAREILRDPYWPLHAAHVLHADVMWPRQYERAKPK
jgi:2,4-dienoyl-CoA reductase-like NADH-dependent reductase (Old Yellow Enzyme family)